MSWPFRFHLGEDALEVRLGSWTARRVPYSDIEGARPGLAFFNEHWTNPWPFRFMTIRRRTGFLKNFVINPDDRDAFQRDLLARVGSGN